MSEGFGMGKTAFVFAVIFGCFAILYPRIFHPMLKSALGIYSKPSIRAEELGPPKPSNIPPKSKHSDPYKETIERTVQSLKAGPHPGMRAETVKRDGAAKSGMAMSVLPIYTVGLVVFLVYTLTKVLFKKPETDEITREQLKNIRFSSNEKKFTFGDDFEGDDDLREFLRKKEQNTVLKPETRKITEYELCQLQRRLEETEHAMEKIVAQMSGVSEKLATSIPITSHKTNSTNTSKAYEKRNIEEEEDEVLTVEIEEIPAESDKVEEQVESISADVTNSETVDKCLNNCETLGILRNEQANDTESHDSDPELFDTTGSVFEVSAENYCKEDVHSDDSTNKKTSQLRKRLFRDDH